jgi:hypothetical protein
MLAAGTDGGLLLYVYIYLFIYINICVCIIFGGVVVCCVYVGGWWWWCVYCVHVFCCVYVGWCVRACVRACVCVVRGAFSVRASMAGVVVLFRCVACIALLTSFVSSFVCLFCVC